MLHFDLQTFGGGKKSKVKTTKAKIPAASTEEKQILQQEMSWLTNAMNASNGLLNLAQNQMNTHGQLTPDYTSLYNTAQQGNNTALNNVNALYPQASNAVTDANNANNGYINNIGSAMNTYQEGNKYLDSDYVNAMNQNANNMASLLNGELPSTYAQNRQQALQSDLTNTVGNTLSSLADRGIINSSVTNQALNDIEKNASNALASQYTNDMNTASGLATSAYNNQLNGLNGRAGLLGNLYANTMNGIGTQAGLSGNNLNNTMNGISTQSQLANQQSALANQPINTAATAQEAATSQPLRYYTTAIGLQEPNANLYSTMSGHRYQIATPSQTYVKQGSGGWFGNLLGGAANGLVHHWTCFPEGTMVATPDGPVEITKIKAGDTVVTVGGVATVKKLHDMGTSQTYSMETEPDVDGISHKVITTPTEVFITPEGRKPLSGIKRGDTVLTTDGFRPVAHVIKGKELHVYELELSDDDSCFYADGFAAEPLTQADIKANKKGA